MAKEIEQVKLTEDEIMEMADIEAAVAEPRGLAKVKAKLKDFSVKKTLKAVGLVAAGAVVGVAAVLVKNGHSDEEAPEDCEYVPYEELPEPEEIPSEEMEVQEF